MRLPMSPPRRLPSAATLPAVLLAAAALVLLSRARRERRTATARPLLEPDGVDNPWQSLQPGMQFTYRGRTIEGSEASAIASSRRSPT